MRGFQPAPRGDLSDEEIGKRLIEFADLCNHYAAIWYKKYGRSNEGDRLFSFDTIEQTARTACWRSLQSYKHDGGSQIRSWVARGVFSRLGAWCKNRLDTYNRRQRLLRTVQWPEFDGELMDVAAPGMDAPESLYQQQMIDEIKAAAQRLPPDDLEIFRMRFEEGLRYFEIGRAMGFTAANARYRVKRLLSVLRQVLAVDPMKPRRGPRFVKVKGSSEWTPAA